MMLVVFYIHQMQIESSARIFFVCVSKAIYFRLSGMTYLILICSLCVDARESRADCRKLQKQTSLRAQKAYSWLLKLNRRINKKENSKIIALASIIESQQQISL